MKFKRIIFSLFAVFFSIIFFFSCAYSRLPKPGPNFVWVKPIKGPKGKIIPGHWIHKGTPKPGKIWVKGHYGPKGRWIPGHWKN